MALHRAILTRLLILLSAVAFLSLFNTFFEHLTPDLSLYLLHARTFVETHNRFSLSFDSKGPMLVLVLAPAVRLLGPTVQAGALTLLAAYLVVGFVLFAVAARVSGRPIGWGVATLWWIVAFSPRTWGGRGRPEDFAMAFAALAFFAVWRRLRWSMAAGCRRPLRPATF